MVACDLPLLDTATLRQLIENRNPNRIATTFQSPHDQLPEPLITIWEPTAFEVLLSNLAKGYKCPRKILIRENIPLLTPNNPQALQNANHKEEYEAIIRTLKGGS